MISCATVRWAPAAWHWQPVRPHCLGLGDHADGVLEFLLRAVRVPGLRQRKVMPLIARCGGIFTTNSQIIFTGVFVCVVPLPIVYLLLRKLFIRSVMAAAIKGE